MTTKPIVENWSSQRQPNKRKTGSRKNCLHTECRHFPHVVIDVRRVALDALLPREDHPKT